MSCAACEAPMDIVPRLNGLVAKRLRSLEAVDQGLVVAVSGGPDSVALLRSVLDAWIAVGIGPVVVAHLNHQLRGADSDADEQFVARLHAELTQAFADLALVCGRLDVAREAASSGKNLEAVARRLR